MSSIEEKQLRRELGLELIEATEPVLDTGEGFLAWDFAPIADVSRQNDIRRIESHID